MALDDEPSKPADKEGVRIIGAQEAAEAEGRDDVAHRRGRDEPRFGDRPAAPDADGPRPAIRFPLPADELPERSTRMQADDTALPHWTEPATGEVPRIFAAEDLDEGSSWSAFSSGQPRWRGEGDRRDDEDHDFSQLMDGETRVGAMADDDRPDPEDFFGFDEEDEWEPEPVRVAGDHEDDDELDEPVRVGGTRTRSITSDPRRSSGARNVGFEKPPGAGRNVPVAIAVGVGFAIVALVAFKAGGKVTIALITAILVVAAVELFTVLRQAGYQPATLLGLASVAALPLAAYWRGEAGIPVVLFLTVVFGLVWYLAGAGGATDRPVIGLSSTLFGVGWIGVLGSSAALILVLPTTTATSDPVGAPGIGVLIAAVLGSVAYDVGGFVIGRNAGSRPLSAASPNKTVEGLAGGVAFAFVAVLLLKFFLAPLSELGIASVALLALGMALAAPLGDLCQSLVKRDLDVKDMGTLLPGHGGLLDRFDGLLFVLPVAYYLCRVFLY